MTCVSSGTTSCARRHARPARRGRPRRAAPSSAGTGSAACRRCRPTGAGRSSATPGRGGTSPYAGARSSAQRAARERLRGPGRRRRAAGSCPSRKNRLDRSARSQHPPQHPEQRRRGPRRASTGARAARTPPVAARVEARARTRRATPPITASSRSIDCRMPATRPNASAAAQKPDDLAVGRVGVAPDDLDRDRRRRRRG